MVWITPRAHSWNNNKPKSLNLTHNEAPEMSSQPLKCTIHAPLFLHEYGLWYSTTNIKIVRFNVRTTTTFEKPNQHNTIHANTRSFYASINLAHDIQTINKLVLFNIQWTNNLEWTAKSLIRLAFSIYSFTKATNKYLSRFFICQDED